MTTADIMFAQPGNSETFREHEYETRTVLLALLAAILIHLLVAFFLAAFGGVFSPATPVEDKPSELTFMDLAPTAPKNSAFIETDESKKAPEPKEKTFESNANSIGASEIGTTGDMPVPSQKGREREFMNLETHRYSLPSEGAQGQPSAATPQPSQGPRVEPTPDQLALLTQTPPPLPQTNRESSERPKSLYRPEQERTIIRGNISN